MADIFISYKREDKPKAAMLANRLMADGWSVWWDHDLLGGEDYDIVIERELAKAKAAIVIWSTMSVQSRNVKDEASKALRRNILVPVSFDGTEPPIGFGMTHTVIFKNRNQVSDEEYQKLYESVKNKTGAPGSPKPKPAPVTQKSKAGWLILGAAIVGIAIFLLVRYTGQNGRTADGNPPVDNGKSVETTAVTGNTGTSKPSAREAEEVAAFFKTMRPLEAPLAGDTISYYTIKEVTNRSITLTVNYNYNAQHGSQVSLGAWLWKSADAGGYQPVMLASTSGSADITITLSDLKAPIQSEGILVFLAESYKGPFTYRVFPYPHTWNP